MTTETAVEQELNRITCVGDDGSWLTVIEYRRVAVVQDARGIRIVPGAHWLALATGEPVRYIDGSTFEVEPTGELIRRS